MRDKVFNKQMSKTAVFQQQFKRRYISQKGSVMVESTFGMFVIVIMLLSMSWYFEVLDFAVQEEINAGVDLRTNMIAANSSCYQEVGVDRVRSVSVPYKIAKFIGTNSQNFDIEYQKVAWSGTCQGLQRSRFDYKNPYRRFRGPNGNSTGSW